VIPVLDGWKDRGQRQSKAVLENTSSGRYVCLT
jgi:hypothetical protein